MKFSKYTSCGNDFIIVDSSVEDALKGGFQELSPNLTVQLSHRGVIQKMCHRHFGIGADGLLLLEKGELAPSRMRIFNSDGSQASMCGNGLRCVVDYLAKKGAPLTVEAGGQIYKSFKDPKTHAITTEFPCPKSSKLHQQLNGQPYHFANVGVEHAVFFKEEINQLNVMKEGSSIRYDSHFAPTGTNVNFAKVLGQTIHLRTYERGVEGETQACGTGAVATALIAHLTQQLPSPLTIIPTSGTPIAVNFESFEGKFSHITTSATAHFIFSGEINLEEFIGKFAYNLEK